MNFISSDIIIDLAKILNVSVDYFFAELSVNVELNEVEFRKFNSKLNKSEQIAVEEKTKEALERYLELENILNIDEAPEFFIYPHIIQTNADAENAAIELRKQSNLGYDPIPDVVEMLEDKGYKVIEVEAPISCDGLKAETGGKKL